MRAIQEVRGKRSAPARFEYAALWFEVREYGRCPLASKRNSELIIKNQKYNPIANIGRIFFISLTARLINWGGLSACASNPSCWLPLGNGSNPDCDFWFASFGIEYSFLVMEVTKWKALIEGSCSLPTEKRFLAVCFMDSRDCNGFRINYPIFESVK